MHRTMSRIAFLLFPALFLLGGACSSAPQEPEARTFDLEIRDRSLAGESTFTVYRDDTVTFRVDADEDGALHLHGYDIEVDFHADAPEEMTFPADTTGRFSFSMHIGHSHGDEETPDAGHADDSETEDEVMLGALEVLPR